MLSIEKLIMNYHDITLNLIQNLIHTFYIHKNDLIISCIQVYDIKGQNQRQSSDNILINLNHNKYIKCDIRINARLFIPQYNRYIIDELTCISFNNEYISGYRHHNTTNNDSILMVLYSFIEYMIDMSIYEFTDGIFEY